MKYIFSIVALLIIGLSSDIEAMGKCYESTITISQSQNHLLGIISEISFLDDDLDINQSTSNEGVINSLFNQNIICFLFKKIKNKSRIVPVNLLTSFLLDLPPPFSITSLY